MNESMMRAIGCTICIIVVVLIGSLIPVRGGRLGKAIAYAICIIVLILTLVAFSFLIPLMNNPFGTWSQERINAYELNARKQAQPVSPRPKISMSLPLNK